MLPAKVSASPHPRPADKCEPPERTRSISPDQLRASSMLRRALKSPIPALLGPGWPRRPAPWAATRALSPAPGWATLRLPVPSQSEGDGLTADLTHPSLSGAANTARFANRLGYTSPVQPVGHRGRHRGRITPNLRYLSLSSNLSLTLTGNGTHGMVGVR